MTQEFNRGIAKNNRSIAKFMNLPIIPNLRFKYHKSWDALMPVVEKIEATPRYYVLICENHCKINKLGDITIVDIHAPTKLQATYTAVTEFITYSKEQK